MSNHESTLLCLSDQTLTEVCHQAGLKATPQRLAILHEVLDARDHPSAEELYERLRRHLPTLSLDTVYRTLAALDGHGIIIKLAGWDGRSRFDGNAAPHHHLVCMECGRLEDFAWPGYEALAPPPPTASWQKIRRVPVEFRGVCPACQDRRRGDASAPE